MQWWEIKEQLTKAIWDATLLKLKKANAYVGGTQRW
jgi:hypothetical protein